MMQIVNIVTYSEQPDNDAEGYHFTGRDNSTKWLAHPPYANVRRLKQNIIRHRCCIKHIAIEAKTARKY